MEEATEEQRKAYKGWLSNKVDHSPITADFTRNLIEALRKDGMTQAELDSVQSDSPRAATVREKIRKKAIEMGGSVTFD